MADRTTWLESVTMIALVLRPWVASMSRPSARASSRSRRMGALDGLTMEMTRSSTTKLPKPTFSNPCFCMVPYSMF
jgi:hypothetical protein